MPIKPRELNLDSYHFRLGVWGENSTGKTHLMFTAPGRLLIINLEGRVDTFYGKFPGKSVQVLDPRSVEETIECLEAALNQAPGFECDTLAIDSITKLVDWVKRDMKLESTGQDQRVLAQGRARERIVAIMDRLYGPLPFHLIVSARQTNDWKGGPKEGIKGQRPDADKRFAYAFDLLVNTQKEVNGQNSRFFGVVTKPWDPYFKVNQRIENFSWKHIERAIAQATGKAPAQQHAPEAQRGAQASTQGRPAQSKAHAADAHAPATGAQVPGASTPSGAPSQRSIKELYVEAGQPGESFVAWWKTQGYKFTDNKPDQVDAGKAREVLTRIIASRSGGGATGDAKTEPAAAPAQAPESNPAQAGQAPEPQAATAPAADPGSARLNKIKAKTIRASATAQGVADLAPYVMRVSGGGTSVLEELSPEQGDMLLAELSKIQQPA